MLQSIREKTSGWIATIILGLVILTLGVFGFESYLTSNLDTYVARVEGPARFLGYGGQEKEITTAEFRQRFELVRERDRQARGEQFDPAAFESMANKRRVLDQLIDEALLSLAAQREGMAMPNSAVQKEILKYDAFKVGGRFDQKQYQLILKGQNMSPQQFQEMLRDELLRATISEQLVATQFTDDSQIDRYLRLSRQTRDMRVLEIPPPETAPAPATDAELKAWYDSHASQYRSPEQVAVEYVEVNAAGLSVDTVADEQSLRQRYDAVKAKFGTLEQRMGSHILVKLDAKASTAEEAAALAKARDIAARARLPGADFAALAAQYSEDAGSKGSGGDLGPIEKGLFGDAFDKAFDALKPGQVSDPVRLPDGWHVILYRELVPGTVKPFELVRAEIEAEFLESERERLFNDISGKLVDKVQEDPNSLATAAKELDLPVNRTPPFSRAAGPGIAALEPVRKAAFSDSQKLDRQASDAIEIGPNHIVVIRVIDHQTAAPLPLQAIRARVAADFEADRRARASKARAEALLARIKAGETLDTIAAEVGRPAMDLPKAGRDAPAPQLQPLFTEAFRLPRPTGGKSEVALAKLAPDRFALVAVSAVEDGDPKSVDAATRATLKEQLARMQGTVEASEFAKALRKQYTIKVAEDRL